MNSALYVGTIAHKRYQPKTHAFSYPFFMYFLDLDDLDNLPDLGRWFSVRRWALNRFERSDYYGESSVPLCLAIKRRMRELTGKPVTGKVYGLMNLRTLGLYFSPVNFYYGFDEDEQFTHFLAEVSNIPWNERHQYAHYVANRQLSAENQKTFKVSPFNPVDQQYSWNITSPGDSLGVSLGVSDERGKIFQASLKLNKYPLSLSIVRRRLLRKPVMTVFLVASIYWQALKLFIKGVPYVPYEKEMI